MGWGPLVGIRCFFLVLIVFFSGLFWGWFLCKVLVFCVVGSTLSWRLLLV